MRALVVFISSLVGIVISQQGFCLDYLKCMEVLEEKQRHCLSLEQNVKQRQTNQCSRLKWEVKLELNGLHMRRAEVARDCVQKSINDAEIAESTLDPDTADRCLSVHKKFSFANKGKNTALTKERKKRSISSSSKKKQTNNSRKTRSTECRNDTKAWHKQCSTLAKCCPIVEDCKLDSRDIMEQINVEREKLQRLNEEC